MRSATRERDRMIPILTAAALACTPVATDGDSIRCGDERIRLLGVDAPEMGPCKPAGRACVGGDPVASRDALASALARGQVTVERVGKDRYGRTLALVWAGGVNLNCAQVRAGHAQYVAKWDDGGRVKRECRG